MMAMICSWQCFLCNASNIGDNDEGINLAYGITEHGGGGAL